MIHDVSVPAALIAGLVSFLSPCVLPLVPPYLVYLTGATIERVTTDELGRAVVTLPVSSNDPIHPTVNIALSGEVGHSTAVTMMTDNGDFGSLCALPHPPRKFRDLPLTVNNSGFTANSGQAGLRIINAASGSGNLVALGGGTALGTGTGVGFGTAGSFMNVNAGSQAITFNTGTGTSTAANAGTLNFTSGQNYTLVVAPAATGSTALRTFLVSGC